MRYTERKRGRQSDVFTVEPHSNVSTGPCGRAHWPSPWSVHIETNILLPTHWNKHQWLYKTKHTYQKSESQKAMNVSYFCHELTLSCYPKGLSVVFFISYQMKMKNKDKDRKLFDMQRNVIIICFTELYWVSAHCSFAQSTTSLMLFFLTTIANFYL